MEIVNVELRGKVMIRSKECRNNGENLSLCHLLFGGADLDFNLINAEIFLKFF